MSPVGRPCGPAGPLQLVPRFYLETRRGELELHLLLKSRGPSSRQSISETRGVARRFTRLPPILDGRRVPCAGAQLNSRSRLPGVNGLLEWGSGMCLAGLRMTQHVAPLSLEATWLGPTCAAGFEASHGEIVPVLKLVSWRWSFTSLGGRTFIPCYDCEAELLLATSPPSARRGSRHTVTLASRYLDRATTWQPTQLNT